MVPDDLIELLRCPQSRQTLAVAGAELVARVNAKAAANERVEAALVRADGTVAYPVRDGIPVLLVDAAISLS